MMHGVKTFAVDSEMDENEEVGDGFSFYFNFFELYFSEEKGNEEKLLFALSLKDMVGFCASDGHPGLSLSTLPYSLGSISLH